MKSNEDIIAHLRDKHFDRCIFNIVQHQTFVIKTKTKRYCFTDIEGKMSNHNFRLIKPKIHGSQKIKKRKQTKDPLKVM